MPVLTMPIALVRSNGSLSVEINEYEPKIAESAPAVLLDSPISLLSEGHTSGPNYGGRQIISKLVEIELDEEGRAVIERSVNTNDRLGERRVEIARDWDGEDYTETVMSSDDDETEAGYRRQLGEDLWEVKYGARVFEVTRESIGDGFIALVARSKKGREKYQGTTLIGPKGRIVANRTAVMHHSSSTSHEVPYHYDSQGLLVSYNMPGTISSGGRPPEGRVTTLVRDKEKRTIDIAEHDGGVESYLETRQYDEVGRYLGSRMIDGIVDIGRITRDTAVDYSLEWVA